MRSVVQKILSKKETIKIAQYPDPKSRPDEQAVGDTTTTGESGRAFAAEKKRKAGTSFGSVRGCFRKRNGKKPLKWWKASIWQQVKKNKCFVAPRKRFSFFSQLAKTGSQRQMRSASVGLFSARGGAKTDLSKFEGCLFSRLVRE